MSVELMLTFLLAFPLLGFIFARIVPDKFSGWIAVAAMCGSFACAVPLSRTAFVSQSLNSLPVLNLGTWLNVGTVSISLSFLMTKVPAFMTLIITGVGLLIHIFSVAYMAHEVRRNRFFSYLNLFVFFMLVLVLGGSLPVTFIGWEGVGLCSYLLISFWYENDNFAAAGKKAFIVNRIGDAGLLLGMFLLISHGQSLESGHYLLPGTISTGISPVFGLPFWEVIAFCLLLGAIGKSAQIPLFVWLPDAMAGPTPVSALIHAATMVTAGVFLIIQYGAIFAAAPHVTFILGVLAAATALFGALVALVKNDIKKVLAYSTVSQLGLMFLGLAAGTQTGALYHVLTHAFFKGCLFLGAGAVILGCHHQQDIRKMGGLLKRMPITATTFLLASLTAAGLPPFGAFFSKGMIVEATSTRPVWFWIAEFVSVCTAAYMTRLFCQVFMGKYRGEDAPHEVSILCTGPLACLALLSVASGVLLHGGQGLASLLGIANGPAESLDLAKDFLHSWPAFVGIAAGFIFWKLQPLTGGIANFVRQVSIPLDRGLYVDELYRAIIVRPIGFVSDTLSKTVEFAVDAVACVVPDILFFATRGLQFVQNGQLRVYGLLLLIGSGIILIVVG